METMNDVSWVLDVKIIEIQRMNSEREAQIISMTDLEVFWVQKHSKPNTAWNVHGKFNSLKKKKES